MIPEGRRASDRFPWRSVPRRGASLVLPLLLLGCDAGTIRPSGIRPAPPRDAREAVQRINQNLSKITGALYCPALASFRFRDAEGRDRRFIGHPATVIFQAPRSLYFDIKSSIGGSVARIGSNDEHYWLWVDTPEVRRLYHGRWGLLRRGQTRRMPVPPDQLLDALMLRPVPDLVPGLSKPLLEVRGNDHRLKFIGLRPDGWPYVKREFRLDTRPPYMPVEIIDRDPEGRVVMHARLGNYRPVRDTGRDGPCTPRSYVVRWELDQAEMRLDFSDVRYRTGDAPFCDFPDQWEGETESLDETAGT